MTLIQSIGPLIKLYRCRERCMCREGKTTEDLLRFVFIGMNSILVYVGHGILWRHFPFSWEMDEYGGHGEKLAMSMTGTALWCLITYYLFTKNVFLKI